MITFKAKTRNGEVINSALSPFSFPAGEAHTKREERRELEPTEIAILQFTPDSIHDDLFQLAMWNSYLTIENADHPPLGPIKRVLIAPYFPGARADRGQPFGLRVYADFVRKLDLNQIIVFDPHSGVTGDELHAASDTLTIVRPYELLDSRIAMSAMPNVYDGIIAPDKGAAIRAQGVADAFGLPLFTAEKSRDFETGKLSGSHIEMPKDGHFLIVDDICDGGGTFLGLALTTPERVLLDLYVSHGVFSKNAVHNLPQQFQNIFTTNSYAPLRDLNVLHIGDSASRVESKPFTRIDVTKLLLDKIK